MTSEEILDAWEIDAVINDTDLITESLKGPSLHSKYFRIYMGEVARMVSLSNDVKSLHLDKYEFYTQGPTSESPPGWQLPAAGRVLKSDVNQYLDADRELISLKTKLEMQKQKIKLLESIISTISFRSNSVRNAIEMIKFQAGS